MNALPSSVIDASKGRQLYHWVLQQIGNFPLFPLLKVRGFGKPIQHDWIPNGLHLLNVDMVQHSRSDLA